MKVKIGKFSLLVEIILGMRFTNIQENFTVKNDGYIDGLKEEVKFNGSNICQWYCLIIVSKYCNHISKVVYKKNRRHNKSHLCRSSQHQKRFIIQNHENQEQKQNKLNHWMKVHLLVCQLNLNKRITRNVLLNIKDSAIVCFLFSGDTSLSSAASQKILPSTISFLLF